VTPRQMAWRTMPRLLYPDGHAYARPFSGNGFMKTVAGLTRADLSAWHGRWFTPANSTLVVSGSVTMAQLKGALTGTLATMWRGGAAPALKHAAAPPTNAGKIYLLHRSDVTQSVIAAAHTVAPAPTCDDLGMDAAMRLLGGMSTSRLNRNLRLDKHWTYGAGASLGSTLGPRMFQVSTSVQADKTAEAMVEIKKEILGIAGARPVKGEEFDNIRRNMVSRLPTTFSTLWSLTMAGVQMAYLHRPEAYFKGYAARAKALTGEQLNGAAKKCINPANLTWMVVGDLEKIEKPIRALKWGEVEILKGVD